MSAFKCELEVDINKFNEDVSLSSFVLVLNIVSRIYVRVYVHVSLELVMQFISNQVNVEHHHSHT
jgi:hypothetical protein